MGDADYEAPNENDFDISGTEEQITQFLALVAKRRKQHEWYLTESPIIPATPTFVVFWVPEDIEDDVRKAAEKLGLCWADHSRR